MDFTKTRKDVLRFFQTTWIPDETYFQTLVRHLIPVVEIQTRALTFLVFSDYGMPATFYNDHYDFLVAQDFLFARKISPDAADLKQHLGQLYASNKADFQITEDGRKLYLFLTQAGRTGQRFAPRIWEKEGQIGHGRTLFILVCKKWHVAKRLMDLLKTYIELPALGFLFGEDPEVLPYLGGILSNQNKINRHRRLVMRLLFEHFQSDRIMICVDPSEIDTLRDFQSDPVETRILDINCMFDDQYLLGHAQRIGLIKGIAENKSTDRVLPSLRNQIDQERETIRQSGFENRFVVSQAAQYDENILELMAFCNLDQYEATRIIEQKWIFSD